jgi:uncharacterized membrane protein YkvA (DUF1232 family)
VDGGLLLGIVLGLLAAWAALVAVLWLVRPRDVVLSDLIAFVPDLVRLVRSLLQDRSVDGRARFALGVLLVWLVSPIDLIPEFIPVLGPLDDVVVAVLVLRYVRRRIGADAVLARWSGSEAGARLLLGLVGAA